MSRSAAAGEVSKEEFLKTIPVSSKQLERFCAQGMPHRREKNRVYFMPLEALRWWGEHREGVGKRAASPTDYDEAKSRKLAAEAELAELELSKARDELMTRADCERIVTDERIRVDARLQSLAPRLAGAVVGATSHNDALARVAPLIEECRDELRNAGPLETETDDGDSD